MALSNIRKNKKIFLPYIIMGIFSVMMYYMLLSLVNNKDIKAMPYSENITIMLSMGMWVARIFIFVFLFYINSFLIKQRLKEIGLYNILGMEKRHIGLMMLFETLTVYVGVISAGLLFGIIFSKMMFLVLMKLIAVKSVPDFDIAAGSIIQSVFYFFILYYLMFLYNVCRIHLSNAVELLHGGEIGEKEPKTKLFMTLTGVVCIGGGYYFSLTTKSPMEAMNMFFAAVIAVVIGTYALFTAGSIVILKMLRKNKSFYYRTGNFMSISGMIYRMKQNAVGLAGICILSTMVLVSISTTVCLYSGVEKTITNRCPKEISVEASVADFTVSSEIDEGIDKINSECGVKTKEYIAIHSMTFFMLHRENGRMVQADNSMNAYIDEYGVEVQIVSLDEYNKNYNENLSLKDDEVYLYTKDRGLENLSEIELELGENINRYKVNDYLEKIDEAFGLERTDGLIKCMLVIVNDKGIMEKLNEQAVSAGCEGSLDYTVMYNTNLSKTESKELASKLYGLDIEGAYIISENKYDMSEQIYQMYGGFLFIGLFTGILFLVAMALIIYYKQISEGYQDRKRFEIMQKVGMSVFEVKKTIRRQVLSVFFIPLAAAGIHVAAAFRIIKMIVKMLAMGETKMYAVCVLVTFIVFALIYALVYGFTAKAYYGIIKAD